MNAGDIGICEKNLNNIVRIADTSTENIETGANNKTKCDFCDGYYKGLRGLNTHIIRSHPERYRNTILERNLEMNTSSTINEQPANQHSNQPVTNISESQNPQQDNTVNNEILKINEKLDNMLTNPSSNDIEIEAIVSEITILFVNAINILPGPRHPAVKYYESRKRRSLFKKVNDRQYKHTSNPQRSSHRDSDKYNYELMQYLYINQRKRCVNKILNNDTLTCPIELSEIFNSFSSRWGTENINTRSSYSSVSNEDILQIDNTFEVIVSTEEVENCIKTIRYDTTPGYDRVLARAIRKTKCSEMLSKIFTIILRKNYVPKQWKLLKTILIFKGGDQNDLNNWRPISISSVIRRLFEKILDRKIKQYLEFNHNQRGFTHQPGTYINYIWMPEKIKNDAKRLCHCVSRHSTSFRFNWTLTFSKHNR